MYYESLKWAAQVCKMATLTIFFAKIQIALKIINEHFNELILKYFKIFMRPYLESSFVTFFW